MQAEIFAIGTELLMGELMDANSTWLAARLPALGIELRRVSLLRDHLTTLSDAMAQAVRTQFNATFAIGVTGVPGPGERAGKPVGLAYFAIASAETVHTQEIRVAPRRTTLKRRVSNAALIELSKLLRGDLRADIEAHW
jgi:hypothetical protein